MSEIELTIATPLLKEFWSRATTIAPLLLKEVDKVARQKGINPAYLRWNIVQQRRYWPSLRNQDALVVVADLLKSQGHYPNLSNMGQDQLGDGSQTDEALEEVANWAGSKMSKALAKFFTLIAKQYAPQVQGMYPDISTSEAVALIIHVVKESLSIDPGQYPNGDTLYVITNKLW